MALTVVVLAAGEGRRMHSAYPKVLARLAGRPLIDHVIERARALEPDSIRVVTGHGGEQVRAHLDTDISTVEQPRQRGTGDAVACGLAGVPEDHVALILYGDVPLVSAQTMAALVDAAARADCAVLTVEVDEPAGYGRIVRDSEGMVARIVEERDAGSAERAIREINTGLMAMRAGPLSGAVARLDNDNAQGEYYLTDVVATVRSAGGAVVAANPDHVWEVEGVNNRQQLARLERNWQLHQAEELLETGVALADPARLDIRGALRTGRDVTIDINCIFEGNVRLGDEVSIGPGCIIRDSEIGDGTRIEAHSIVAGVCLERACVVGPFARLRPGVEMLAGARVGNFVELKNTTVGSGSKINHLAYVGDTRIGRDANIGAGVITCNYDGHEKHRTEIGDRVFIGSDSQLVAPVRIGDDATIGAGSTITRDAPPGELSLSRSRQQAVRGWKRPAVRGKDDD